jgi:hypothetical protein
MVTRVQDDFDLGRTILLLVFGTIAAGIAILLINTTGPEPEVRQEVASSGLVVELPEVPFISPTFPEQRERTFQLAANID